MVRLQLAPVTRSRSSAVLKVTSPTILTNASDGSVVMQNFGTVNYIGLEPLTNTGTATNVIFNLPTGANSDVTLTQSGADITLAGSTFEDTTFNSTGITSLTINGNSANDTLTVNGSVSVPGSLTINLQGGTDALVVNGALAAGGTMNLTAESVNLNANLSTTSGGAVNINATTVTSALGTDISAQGVVSITGSATGLVTGTGSVSLQSVRTSGGNVTVTAGVGGLTVDTITSNAITAPATVTLSSGGTLVSETSIQASAQVILNAQGDITVDQINPATNVPVTITSTIGKVQSEAGPATGYISSSSVAISANKGIDVRTNAANLSALNENRVTPSSLASGNVKITQVLPNALSIDNVFNDASGADITIENISTLSGASVTVVGTVRAVNGDVSITSNNLITVGGQVQTITGSGDIVLNAKAGVQVQNTGSVSADLGTITVDADSDLSSAGLFTNAGGISTNNTSNSAVVITALDMVLTGTITSLAGRTHLRNSRAALPFTLGTNATGAFISLSDSELSTISASSVEIGRTDAVPSGLITIAGPIAPAGTSTLILRTVSGVIDTGSGSIAETNLKIVAGDDVLLDGGNNVANLVADVTTIGKSFAYNDTSDVTIPSTAIDSTLGITTKNGTVSLRSTSLTVQSAINTVDTTGAVVNLIQDNITLSGTGNVTSGSADINVRPLTATTVISLGGADAPTTLGIDQIDLDHLSTTGFVRIGGSTSTSLGTNTNPINTGDISLDGSVTQATTGFTKLSLITQGKVIDNTASEQADITVTDLAIRTGTGVGNTGDVDVTVTNLAVRNDQITTPTGAISINTLGNVTITTVDGAVGVFNGAATGSNGISIDVDAGNSQAGTLTALQEIKSTSGRLRYQPIRILA